MQRRRRVNSTKQYFEKHRIEIILAWTLSTDHDGHRSWCCCACLHLSANDVAHRAKKMILYVLILGRTSTTRKNTFFKGNVVLDATTPSHHHRPVVFWNGLFSVWFCIPIGQTNGRQPCVGCSREGPFLLVLVFLVPCLSGAARLRCSLLPYAILARRHGQQIRVPCAL